MSNIPRARKTLAIGIRAKKITKAELKRLMLLAYRLMFRRKWLSHAREKPQPKITHAMGRRIRAMVRSRNYTQAEIAIKLGLRRPGRISEWLRGKR